ncbi:hypothetical protein Bresa_01226|uniref:Type III effector n=1 Tax=Brenneria salicis ATCC 15712 = DSM 30166 TaxID=714314 RepID=A0A366ICG4_9GAMM|nr:hypothetical protein [Brenneria salicis]NMN91100.1 hypothetical protein [Brenneria salicis ATCC 15712 = DSM 30166]RBP66598.1 hypothetical protein DES54_103128 [Brenneria salicis ATCC 15712 = DSM 30166]RLM31961.1 hypothetical protein BHG07_02375 [Brenneria salicis ATCC 15712 = DSM 30166]
MNRLGHIFSGGSSSSGASWNALNQDHSIVKTHEQFSAQSLGLSSYQYRTVQVKSSTMENLAQAAWANQVVKNILHAGAGNQIKDISSSSGESWARAKLADDAYSGGNSLAQLKRAQKMQGGNCPVFASTASAVLQGKTDAPMMRVRTRLPEGNSHEFLLLGDRRASRWGDRNTVVVDAWPVKPSASTFDQTFIQDARSGEKLSLRDVLSEYCNEEYSAYTFSNKDRDRLTSIKPLDTDAIDRKLHKQHLPSIGDELVEHIFATESDNLFDARVSTDPSTYYTDGDETRTFDNILSR